MKRNKLLIKVSLSSLLLAGVVGACKDEFLEQPPQGTFAGGTLASSLQGLNGLVVGAYSGLNGRPGSFTSGATNWVFGSVAADDANKGTEPADFSALNDIELYQQLPSNGPVQDKWTGVVDGIGLANDALRALQASTISEAEKTRLIGQVRFLRGFYHMEGRKVFGMYFPYIGENLEDLNTTTNAQEIWPKIEEDFKFAYDNLESKMDQPGRANKWAAAAFLAKAYVFQSKYAEAKTVLDDIIANGTTAGGVKYGLMDNYGANFRVADKNNRESVFAIQSAINDGAANNTNGNYEFGLNFPHGAGDKPGGCCGFFQPSFALVNSYMTNPVTGLPEFNPYTTNGVTNDAALTSADPFTPYTGTLDPRLDHTVGRRDIPFLDWGLHPGRSWIRDVTNGGPFSPKKNVHSKAELSGKEAGTGGWGQPVNAINFPLMRYSDVLLMAAEAEAQVGSLDQAMEYVNMIRARAANEASWIRRADGTPAANYKVGLYDSFPSKDFAMKAIMEERKLELAMEGHRKFDLVRTGLAAQVLNAYVNFEQQFLPKFRNAQFTKGQDEYMPVPSIIVTSSVLNGVERVKQNPAY
jgi:hypothetical protein